MRNVNTRKTLHGGSTRIIMKGMFATACFQLASAAHWQRQRVAAAETPHVTHVKLLSRLCKQRGSFSEKIK
jgi:hypothetical protein